MSDKCKQSFLYKTQHSVTAVCEERSHNLRGRLSKNHPLKLAQKIILPETLATERLYQGWNSISPCQSPSKSSSETMFR